jgi:probable addiction module antidote protein
MTLKIKISKWDSADYLKTQASIDSYLEAAFTDGDPKVITRALGDIARAKNMTKIADKSGVHRVHLYRALSVNGDPKLSTLTKVVNSLGYHLSLTPNAPRRQTASKL